MVALLLENGGVALDDHSTHAWTWQNIANGSTGEGYLGCLQGPCHYCRWVVRRIPNVMPNVIFDVTYSDPRNGFSQDLPGGEPGESFEEGSIG
ncbi:hypothetical protein ACFU96_14200 [Streptomyces sp. NPDC057620]|uniref:hypothetical protein n=1 Tax=Streptomyces sp. NPDC057620 TaxID=3346185 RepID=UPI0036C1AE41